MKRPPVKLFSWQWWVHRTALAVVTTAAWLVCLPAGALPAVVAGVTAGVLFLIWVEGL